MKNLLCKKNKMFAIFLCKSSIYLKTLTDFYKTRAYLKNEKFIVHPKNK